MTENEQPSPQLVFNQTDLDFVKKHKLFPGTLLINALTGERDYSQFGGLAEEYEQRWLIYEAMPKRCNCLNCQFNRVPENPLLREGASWLSDLFNKIQWALRDKGGE